MYLGVLYGSQCSLPFCAALARNTCSSLTQPSLSTVYLHPSSRISPPPAPTQEPDDLFETLSQALLAAVDRDCLAGWGAVVHIMYVAVSSCVALVCFGSPCLSHLFHEPSLARCQQTSLCSPSSFVCDLLLSSEPRCLCFADSAHPSTCFFLTLSDIFYTAPRHHPFRCRPPPGASVHVVILFLSS